MTGRRFKVGDQVRITGPANNNPAQPFLDVVRTAETEHPDTWEVIRLRPADEAGVQYQVRSDNGLERVVHEDELAPANDGPPLT